MHFHLWKLELCLWRQQIPRTQSVTSTLEVWEHCPKPILWAPQVDLLLDAEGLYFNFVLQWILHKWGYSFICCLLTWIPSVFCTVHIRLWNFYIFLPECAYSLAVFISVPVEMPFSIRNSNFLWLLILQNNYLLGWNSLGCFSSRGGGLGGVCSTFPGSLDIYIHANAL